MPIEVNESFLRDEVVAANRRLSAEAPVAGNGKVSEIIGKPGNSNFQPGQRLWALVQSRGTEMQKRCEEVGTRCGNRAMQILHFLAMAEEGETINKMTAAELLKQLPDWGGGKGGAPTPESPPAT